MGSLRRRRALQAAVLLFAAAPWLYEVEAASSLDLTNVRTQVSARPNEWIRVTWSTKSSSRVHASVYWGTRHGALSRVGEGPHAAAAGSHGWYNRIQVPDHPCTIFYVVHVKDADGHRVESAEGEVRVEIPPVAPGALGFTVRPGKRIPDAGTGGITAEIAVPSSGVLNRVEVRVDITHPRRGDLTIDLVSPRGTRVRLHQSGKDARANIRGCFGDGVPGDLVSYDDLGILQGEPFGGKWKLVVADHAAGDAGVLHLFALTIYVHAPSAPPSPGEVLPNLVMRAPDEVDITWEGKTKLLEFSTTVANMGPGPFTMRGQWNPATHAQDAYQQIFEKQYDAQGRFEKFAFVREEKVGEFVFDDDEGHQHFHFKDWASYVLLDDKLAPAPGARDRIKVSFAIEDVSEVDPNLEGASLGGTFPSGSRWVQGISVGWSDTYGAGLEGQSVDVTHTPDGVYYLVLEGTKLVEESDPDKTDDDAAVRIRIRGSNVKVLEKLTGKELHDRMSGAAPLPPPPPAPKPTPAPPATHGPVSYRHDIQPLWNRHCITCHRTHAAAAPFSLEASRSWRALVNAHALEARGLERVRPRSPQASYLWHKLEGTQRQVGGSGARMPEGGHMTAAELAKIRKWIAEGAPNN